MDVFNVQIRAGAGTSAARNIRKQGAIPGVLYGMGQDPVSVTLDKTQIVKAMNAGRLLSTVAMLDHEGAKQRVIAKEVQTHPINGLPMHVDLFRVDADSVISMAISVHFINQEHSKGIKRGGTLNIVRHEIELNVPAAAVPEHIEADVGNLDIGDTLHISALTLPEGVTPIIADRDFTIATIAAPSVEKPVEEEAETEDGDEDSEPEADS